MSSPFSPRAVLVTGGAGFIGSNLVRWILQHHQDVAVVVLDALTYAGNLESLAAVRHAHGPDGDGRLYFVHGDVRERTRVAELLSGGAREACTGRGIPRVDAVLHLAAESHVDRSILGPEDFLATNVQGTVSVLEASRDSLEEIPREFRFLHVSTDEVYGSVALDDSPVTESHPLAPNSPYAASKAAADCFVRAYFETYGIPSIITRSCNNYGPFQFPEKLIPLMVTRALADECLPVYGDGSNRRDWLHVADHADALWRILGYGRIGAIYNVAAGEERTNLDVVHAILEQLGKPRSLIRFVNDRPGHDKRYAMDFSAVRGLGWAPRKAFTTGLRETTRWFLENRAWWNRSSTEAYRVAQSLYLGAETTI